LAGAGQRLHEVAGYSRTPAHWDEDERRLRRARQALGEALQAAAWAEGLAADERPEVPPTAAAMLAADLTAREWEVAALIAQGLTNRQIGDALVISEGTARVHVAHVLAKLGFHSRVQVAAWAAEHGLRGPAAEAAPAPGA
jgi:DNA-binding NarL/FixJ family response regulator